MEFSTSSKTLRLYFDIWINMSCQRPRQVISAINIPLSVMLGPVLACRLVNIPLNKYFQSEPYNRF